eukprot:scaffold163961_cov44-Prasinocladus_malaysianus.AAC.3
MIEYETGEMVVASFAHMYEYGHDQFLHFGILPFIPEVVTLCNALGGVISGLFLSQHPICSIKGWDVQYIVPLVYLLLKSRIGVMAGFA